HLWPSAEKRTDISITVVIANCHCCWVLVSATFYGCGCIVAHRGRLAKIFPCLWILVTLSAVVAILVINKALNVTLILRIRSGLRGFRPSVWSLRGTLVQKESSNHLSVVFRTFGWCFLGLIGQERWLADSSVANLDS
ncbi:hypothetical protein Dimus_037726, partial [Dionaea muscipula]